MNRITLSLITPFLWLLFIACLLFLGANYSVFSETYLYGALRVNAFTLLIWTVVTFFSAIISSYANKYLSGFRYHRNFKLFSLGFTFSVILFVMSNHLALIAGSWFLMGLFMSRLIGVDKDWKAANEAARFAQLNFLVSTLILSLGLAILAISTNDVTLIGVLAKIGSLPKFITLTTAMLLIIAALIQSAIFPFHKWLLSAMTAPTPASALMHAGFINGAGILLALFASLFFNSGTLELLFLIGGATAIVAQFSKLLQVNVKQKLACSTIAQMGFMIMQCGLGFFNAAVAHLILHGFYKAYQFLSVGEGITHTRPQETLRIKIKPLQAIMVIVSGVIGAFVFNVLTGKGFVANSSIFLTLIVAITVGQVTYNFTKEKSFSVLQKLILPPVLYLTGIFVYAMVYNFVTIVMSDMALVATPTSLSFIHIAFGVVFLIGFIVMKLGLYQKFPWIYVQFLNMTQPSRKTV